MVGHRDRHLVLDALFNVGDAEDVAEQRVPELLILAFFAAALERPVFDKLPCGLPLRRVRFRFHSLTGENYTINAPNPPRHAARSNGYPQTGKMCYTKGELP